MRSLALLVLFGFGIAAAGGCSLNPQPFPPGTYDASAADASLQSGPDAAGGVPDGSPTGDDAGTTDAGEDAAALDASDASDADDGDADDASDARDDVDDAGETG